MVASQRQFAWLIGAPALHLRNATIARAQSQQTKNSRAMGRPYRGGPHRIVSYRWAASSLYSVTVRLGGSKKSSDE